MSKTLVGNITGPKGDKGDPGDIGEISDAEVSGLLADDGTDTNAAVVELVAGQIPDQETPIGGALSATFGGIQPLVGVPFYIEGDSYAQDNPPSSGTYANPGTLPFSRLARRWMTATPTNTAVGGTRSDQILGRILSGYTVNRAGIVGLGDLLINDTNVDADASGGPVTSAATCRTIFEVLSARAQMLASSDSFAFDEDWSSGVSSTATSKFNLAFNGDAVVLLLNFGSGSGATLTVTDEDDDEVATITTGGYTRTFVGSVRLDGFGSGNHELTVTLDSGTATINSALIPNDPAVAPLVIWDKPGARRYGTSIDARLATYQAAVQAVADEFPNVLSVDMGSGWDKDTMIGPDNGHRNDLGNDYAAQRIHEAVSAEVTGYRQGVNRLVNTGAGPTYTPVAATPLVDPPIVVSADTFTRADSSTLGTTETGGFTWAEASGADFDINSGDLRVVTTSSMPVASIDDGEADGTIALTLRSAAMTGGIFFRSASGLADGYLFYHSGNYKLMKRTGGSFSLIANADPVPTFAVGDKIEVVLDGSSIICKVNGVTVVTTTQTDYVTNTVHGAYISTASQRVDNWLHTIPA